MTFSIVDVKRKPAKKTRRNMPLVHDGHHVRTCTTAWWWVEPGGGSLVGKKEYLMSSRQNILHF